MRRILVLVLFFGAFFVASKSFAANPYIQNIIFGHDQNGDFIEMDWMGVPNSGDTCNRDMVAVWMNQENPAGGLGAAPSGSGDLGGRFGYSFSGFGGYGFASGLPVYGCANNDPELSRALPFHLKAYLNQSGYPSFGPFSSSSFITVQIVTHDPVHCCVQDTVIMNDPEHYFWRDSTRREPIIIVPGIMGTRLNRVSDGEEVWPNVNLMKNPGPDSYLSELTLPAHDSTFIVATDVISVATTSFLGLTIERPYLRDVLDEFRRNGYEDDINLFTFPYDWRIDVRDSANELSGVIQSAISNSPTGKVNIIAHSLGGLVVKSYIKEFGGTAINKLILVGVPQLGAPKVFKILNYGDNVDFEFLGFDILNPDRVKEITQNMPSVYQLLPSRRYVDLIGGYVKDFRGGSNILNYDQTNQFMLSNATDTRNPFLLDLGDLFHSGLDGAPFNASSVYNIVGCQNPETIGEFRIYDGGKVDITAVDGDGTVPTISAMNLADGYKNFFVLNSMTDINHTRLVSDEGMAQLIAAIVNNQSFTLPIGVSRSVADCFQELPEPTKIIFSIHSPAALHVYDSRGRHVGPIENGDIELSIPGSDYERIEGSSFAFVPANGFYRVFADALSEGAFDLKVRTFNGSVLTEAITYLNVPLQSASTTAELNFPVIGGDFTLKIDTNGDGAFDTSIQPTGILPGAVASDITPPQIDIISPEPRDYLRSEFLRLVINLTDTESGVAFTHVSMDGRIVTSSTLDLFFERLGNHTLFVNISDRAGNPTRKEVNLRIVATPESIISDINRAFSLGWIDNRGIKESLVIKAKQGLWRSLLSELNAQRGRHINNSAHQLLQEDVKWVLET